MTEKSVDVEVTNETLKIVDEEFDRISLEKLKRKTGLTEGQLYYVAYVLLHKPFRKSLHTGGSYQKKMAGRMDKSNSIYLGKAVGEKLKLEKGLQPDTRFDVEIVESEQILLKLLPRK